MSTSEVDKVESMVSIKRWFLNNPGLKVLSLILALLLWVYVRGEYGGAGVPFQRGFVERTFEEVDVKLLSLGAEGISAKLNPSKVSLRLAGPKAHINRLTQSEILAFVEIDKLARGKYEFPLKLILPEDIKLVSETPTIGVIIK